MENRIDHNGSNGFSRRGFVALGTAAATVATAAGVRAALVPTDSEGTAAFNALWGARYKRAVAEHAAATHAYCAAIARLPWWAAVGPSYATRGGLLEKGPVCGWPAVQTWEAPGVPDRSSADPPRPA